MTWRDDLFSRRTLGVRLGLAAIERVDAQLGRPAVAANVVHVVGTNGKGSTSAMVAHGLRRTGAQPVGLFTSPHLVRVGERLQVDGLPATEAEVEGYVEQVLAAERAVGERLSFFEVITLVALLHFEARGAKWLVLEAGLGGRLDSTRLRRSSITLVTRIAMDHQQFLGDTIEAIAAEKAAVIHANAPVFSVEQDPRVSAVLASTAAKVGADLRVVPPTVRPPQGLGGDFQRHNAGLALAALGAIWGAATLADLDDVSWPGRWDRRRVNQADVVFDVGHNPDAIANLRPEIARFAPDLIVFGCMPDKDAALMAAELGTYGRRHLWVRLVDDAVPPGATWCDVGLVDGRPFSERWITETREPQRILVCGSHVLVGALFGRLGDSATPDPGDPRHQAAASDIHTGR